MCNHSHQPTTIGTSLKDGIHHDKAHLRWSRRQFLKGLGLAASGVTMGLNGRPVKAFHTSPLLQKLAGAKSNRVLVLVQLSGGNDGLNMVVPYSDPEYYRVRPSIAIPGSDVIPLTDHTGLHPNLAPFESLYGDGVMQVLHGVGYDNPALSHFTSTDVWMTAGSANDVGSSGWLGRYLEASNPELLAAPPDHPYALQLGSGSPLLFQGNTSSLGVQFPNLSLLERFVEEGILFDEEFVPDTPFGHELSYIRSIANDSFHFAESIQTASETGANLTEYPSTNGLSGNMAITARLIRGGLGANLYHLNLGGFDTHSSQISRHRSLMDQLSAAISAFMTDLATDGLDQEVLVMTFSEFGRRVYQNGSGGTDHGTSAPLFMFGGGVTGGIIGEQPSLTDLAPGGNLKHGIDFRGLYSSILRDWFGLSEDDVLDVMGASFTPLPIIDSTFITSSESVHLPVSARLTGNYPNPFRYRTTIEIELDRAQHIRLEIFDLQGRNLTTLSNRMVSAGTHRISFAAENLPSGSYFARLTTRSGSQTHKLSVIR
ncbi:MAG: DUF1501 domain-containing protein [Bacteroidetes Order II. Incertae sedis bacterium]|nr:DUF1501 domain-containing protein [Bacteroidetes Order II. bacterium]